MEISIAKRARLLYGLTACHFINDFYAMVIPPLLPALMLTFGLSYAQGGIISFFIIFSSAILQPTIGYYADLHRQRKVAIIVGLVLTGIAIGLLGMAPSYFILLLVALLIGIAGSTYHPQSTTLIVAYFPDNKGRASGIHGIGNALGFALAPLTVGYLLSILDWRSVTPFLIFPGILAAILAWKLFEEPPMVGSKGFLQGISGQLVLLTLVNGFGLMAFQGFITFLPAFYVKEGATIYKAGIMSAMMLATGMVAQPLGGWLSDKLGRKNVIIASLALSPLFLLAFINSSGALPLIFSIGLGFCLLFLPPISLIFATELATGERTGSSVGVVWGIGIAMSALTPPLVGYLTDAFGFHTAYFSLAALPVIGVILAMFLPGKTHAALPVKPALGTK